MITGYASVFYDPGNSGTEYSLGDNFVERIMSTAFDDVLTGSEDVVALFNHDPSLVLGRRSSGTLRLSKDAVGLRYEIDEADTQISRDVAEHQARRDLIGSSFGFMVMEESNKEVDGLWIREIHKVSLRDVGPVTFPAYSGTNDVRFVTLDARCMEMPAEFASEVRSSLKFPVSQKDMRSAVATRLVRIRADAIRVESERR